MIVILECSHCVQQRNTFLLDRTTRGKGLQPCWFPDGPEVAVDSSG